MSISFKRAGMLISVKGLGSQRWGWFGLTNTATQCCAEQGKGKQMDGGQQLHKSMPDLSTTSSLPPLLPFFFSVSFLLPYLPHFPFNSTISSTLPPPSLRPPSILHVCHPILLSLCSQESFPQQSIHSGAVHPQSALFP